MRKTGYNPVALQGSFLEIFGFPTDIPTLSRLLNELSGRQDPVCRRINRIQPVGNHGHRRKTFLKEQMSATPNLFRMPAHSLSLFQENNCLCHQPVPNKNRCHSSGGTASSDNTYKFLGIKVGVADFYRAQRGASGISRRSMG